MVRNYKRKTQKRDENSIRRAVAAMLNGMSLRAAARDFGIPRSTLLLHRRANEVTTQSTELDINSFTITSQGRNTVFTKDQETAFEVYLKYASDVFFGLTATQTRLLAYEFAEQVRAKFPESWKDEKKAGLDWLRGFMQRHQRVSLRKPEATSIARASAFNRHNVAKFFENYKKVCDLHVFGPNNIWNVDETDVTTAHHTDRVVARRGCRHVGQVTSAERGKLVTVILPVSAIGMRMPPYIVFPRARFEEYYLNGGPVGSIGGASPSGLITADLFLDFLKHFQAFTRSSPDQPVLLFMDNHESHRSLAALEFCRAHGIHAVSFPPHCSHRLQPLDISIFRPFKTAMNQQSLNFMQMYPGRQIQIFDIPAMVNRALEIGATEVNIKAGFRATGIWPVDPDIFQDIDFMPSLTTDRPLETAESDNEQKYDVPFTPPPASSKPTTSRTSLNGTLDSKPKNVEAASYLSSESDDFD